MTPHRVVIAGRARAAALRIGAWWKENRSAAPHVFGDELADALELITTAPGVGEPWPSTRVRGVRRWLMTKTRYHLYYTVDEARGAVTITVRMIWYAGRAHGPRL